MYSFETETLDVPRFPLTQSADGRAHFAYYSDHHSFCWAGDVAESMEISYGGAGEPAQWLVHFTAPYEPTTPDQFKRQCEHWLWLGEVMEEDGHTRTCDRQCTSSRRGFANGCVAYEYTYELPYRA